MKAFIILFLALFCSQAASAQTVLFEELPLPAAADFVGPVDWVNGGLYSNGGDTVFVRMMSGKVFVTTDGGQHWMYATEVPFDFLGTISGGALTSEGCLVLTFALPGDWFSTPQQFRPPMPKVVESSEFYEYPPIICLKDGVVTVEPFNPGVDIGPHQHNTALGKQDRIISSMFRPNETHFSITIHDGFGAAKRDTILPLEGRIQNILGHYSGEFVLIGSSNAAFSDDNGETWLSVARPTCSTANHIMIGESRVMCVEENSTVRVWDILSGSLLSEHPLPFTYHWVHRMQLSHTGGLLIDNDHEKQYWFSEDAGSTWASYPNRRRLQLRGSRLYALDGIRLTQIVGTTEIDVTGDLRTMHTPEEYAYGYEDYLKTAGNLLVWGFESMNPYYTYPNGSIYSTDAGLNWHTLPEIDGVIRSLLKMPDGRIAASGFEHLSFYDPANDIWQMNPDTIDSRIMILVQDTDLRLLRTDEYFVVWNVPLNFPRPYGLWKRGESESGTTWVDILPNMSMFQIGSYSDGRIVARGGILDAEYTIVQRKHIHLFESSDAGETWTQLTDEPSTVKFFHHDHDYFRVFRVNQDRWLEMHTEGVSIPLFQLNATEIPKTLLSFASNAMVFQTSEGFYGTMDGGSQWIPLQYPFNPNKVDIVNAGGHLVAVDRDAQRLYRTQTIYPTSISAPASTPTASGVSVTTYPNPTRSNVAFQVDLAVGADVEIIIYDMLGRRVAALHPSRMPSGTHTLSLQMSHLANGVYVYSMKVGTTMLTGRIVRM